MLIALALAASAPAPAIPEGEALTEAIRARDSEFFATVFEGCDPERLAAMLTPDFEMYHDKGGVVARSAETFVAQYAKDCEGRKAPDAWRSRRELVRSSLHVDPVPGHGAIQTGEHLFYERKGVNGAEKLVGRAKFAQLWVLGADGKWRLSRVFSYAHGPAE